VDARDVLRALDNPVARSAIVTVLDRLTGSARVRAQSPAERDYERLHWGNRPRGPGGLVPLPPAPDRMVKLGAVSRIGYITAKDGDEPEEFIHCFGREVERDVFEGARPLLVVGFYDDEPEREELFLLRGKSPYRVTTHGIEG
jgi:hypothetical protein